MNVCNKLECFSLAGFCSLVSNEPGAYPRVEYLKGASLGLPLASLKNKTRLEKLARDKHSSLLRTFVNCGRKKFYGIGPRLCYFRLKAATLQPERSETDFCSKIFETTLYEILLQRIVP
jgi:hypothetical protein